MLPYRSTGSPRIDDFRVRLQQRPGWVRGSTRLPQTGEEIFCAGGPGTVTALHGKTGDGSRLVQIKLDSQANRPFFASASNVLVSPAGVGGAGDHADLGHEPTKPAIWLGGSGRAAHVS